MSGLSSLERLLTAIQRRSSGELMPLYIEHFLLRSQLVERGEGCNNRPLFMGTLFHFPYRTVAEISIPALVKNLVTLRALCKKEIIPVVKADAYGHGMVPIAKALVSRGSCHTL